MFLYKQKNGCAVWKEVTCMNINIWASVSFSSFFWLSVLQVYVLFWLHVPLGARKNIVTSHVLILKFQYCSHWSHHREHALIASLCAFPAVMTTFLVNTPADSAGVCRTVVDPSYFECRRNAKSLMSRHMRHNMQILIGCWPFYPPSMAVQI